MRRIFFPHRIPEPKAMNRLELEVFEKASKENYKRWMIPLVDDALENSNLKEGKILDVGCGPGLLAKEFARRSKKFYVVGVDISLRALQLARKNCRGLSNLVFKKANVCRLPFSEQSFDLVVCKDSLHHFSNLKSALKEMHRVTKDRGVIYIQDLRRDLPWYLLKTVIPPKNTFQKLQYYSARASYTKKELGNILNGLDIKSYTITTRQVRQNIKKKYKSIGVDLTKLKEGFQARYVAVIKKKNY